MDLDTIMYISGVVASFITCWILYIYDIKRSYTTIKERKVHFMDGIYIVFCGFVLVSMFSWITMGVIMTVLLGIAINKFLKYIINDTNFGKFLIHKILG